MNPLVPAMINASGYVPADPVARSVAACGRTGPMAFNGSASTAHIEIARMPIAANAIQPGATLDLRATFVNYLAATTSARMEVRLVQGAQSVLLMQSSVAVVNGFASLQSILNLNWDRKSAVTYSTNAFGAAALARNTLYPAQGTLDSTRSLRGARSPGNVMFVAYSAPPTEETVLIDFTQPMSVSVLLAGGSQGISDLELIGFAMHQYSANPAILATTWFCWGDSLTEGTGAVAAGGLPMDWVSQFRRLRYGWPIEARGLGGQRSLAIADRVLADPVMGRMANAVLWMGYNDFNNNVGNPQGWWDAVHAQIERVLAFRVNPKTLICNFHPNADWAVGSANYQAMEFVNRKILEMYGERVVDLKSALATDNGKVPAASMADSVHLANPGHTTVAAAVNAKITTLGW